MTCLDATFIFLLFQGVRATPIVNGFGKPVEPQPNVYPFHVSLLQTIDDGKTYHSFCGGSLIHPQWVLTAAHCIQLDSSESAMKPADVHVALGSVWRNAKGAQIIGSSSLKIHPRYLATGRHDIGIIKLKYPAKIGTSVRLVKLHTDRKENLLGRTAYLTGFGIINDFYEAPDRLRRATLHVTSSRNCFDGIFSGLELCAASTIAEGKACKGDSGGPLFFIRNSTYYQIGVTSHLALLPLCRISFNNSVYTRVSIYIAWLSKITGIDFSKYNQ